MALLASATYDPGTAVVNKATTAAAVMAAVDTTNLRLQFTAPSNGAVFVRLKTQVHGATTFPQILLGLLQHSGGAVVARAAPVGAAQNALATNLMAQEVAFVVSGLSGAVDWDVAYGVETVVAATNIKYGGANTNGGANAYGAFVAEVMTTPGLLGSILLDPAGAVTKATTSLLAMTAIDTSAARITFVAPPSGKVFWRAAVSQHGSTTVGQSLLGILDGATVKARVAPSIGAAGAPAIATTCYVQQGSGFITGLTPGNTYNFDLAYAVQVVAGAGGLKYGGPNNTSANDAFGALCYDIWAA